MSIWHTIDDEHADGGLTWFRTYRVHGPLGVTEARFMRMPTINPMRNRETFPLDDEGRSWFGEQVTYHGAQRRSPVDDERPCELEPLGGRCFFGVHASLAAPLVVTWIRGDQDDSIVHDFLTVYYTGLWDDGEMEIPPTFAENMKLLDFILGR